jgi:hypothetical protein
VKSWKDKMPGTFSLAWVSSSVQRVCSCRTSGLAFVLRDREIAREDSPNGSIPRLISPLLDKVQPSHIHDRSKSLESSSWVS